MSFSTVDKEAQRTKWPVDGNTLYTGRFLVNHALCPRDVQYGRGMNESLFP